MLVSNISQGAILPLIRTAWAESPSLAIELCVRFQSARVHKEVRTLLLSSPEKAINDPEALSIMLGTSLPSDLPTQLKVRLQSPVLKSNY